MKGDGSLEFLHAVGAPYSAIAVRGPCGRSGREGAPGEGWTWALWLRSAFREVVEERHVWDSGSTGRRRWHRLIARP
jgi:hypothetical protein